MTSLILCGPGNKHQRFCMSTILSPLYSYCFGGSQQTRTAYKLDFWFIASHYLRPPLNENQVHFIQHVQWVSNSSCSADLLTTNLITLLTTEYQHAASIYTACWKCVSVVSWQRNVKGRLFNSFETYQTKMPNIFWFFLGFAAFLCFITL